MNPLGISLVAHLSKSTMDRLRQIDRANKWFTTIDEAQNKVALILGVKKISTLTPEEENILRFHLLS